MAAFYVILIKIKQLHLFTGNEAPKIIYTIFSAHALKWRLTKHKTLKTLKTLKIPEKMSILIYTLHVKNLVIR